MFIYMQKINFIPHLVHNILYFQESCTLTGREHFGPRLKNQNFSRCVVCAETIIAIWFFILDYMLKYVMKKNNKMKIFKNCKKHRTGAIFWPLSSKIRPMKTCLENQSLAFIILNSHKKWEKPNKPFLRKTVNRKTYRLTELTL